MAALHIPRRFRAIAMPEDRRLMEPLVLVLCLFAVAVAFLPLAILLYHEAGTPGYDFRYFWLAGKIWSEGLSPYGAAFHQAGQRLITSGHVPEIWPYPPNMWLPAVGLAQFDLKTAWYVMLALQILAIPVASAALAYIMPLDRLPGVGAQRAGLTRFGFFLLHTAFVASLEASRMAISPGQISIFVYLGAVFIICGLARESRSLLVTGLVIIFLKPQIGAVLALALMLTGRAGTRAVFVAALISALLTIPAMMLKPDVLLDWLTTIRNYDNASLSNIPVSMSGIRNLVWALSHVDIGSIAATGGSFAASIGVTLVLRRVASTNGKSAPDAACDLAIAQFLVIMATASLHLYDFTLLGVGVLALAGVARLRVVSAVISVAMTVQPSALFLVLGGAPTWLIFPGSTIATIGVTLILVIFLTRTPAESVATRFEALAASPNRA